MKSQKDSSKVKVMQTVVAIIFDLEEKKPHEPKFLILKKQGTWEGWQFVQGEKEKEESYEEAVKREVKEETGLDCTVIAHLKNIKGDYWFKWEGKLIHKFLHFFLVRADSKKKVKLSIEHSDFKWCGYEEALKSIKYNKEQFKQAYKELKKILKQRTLQLY
ncbi:hypothetical protein DRJ19_01485 [Candidatus Woesearchaeota archaeon]|nr:MAG: hypothetical protein DRJ19_01485 [Candidatus Woesearchaeota archaeon]HDM43612.1 NUDIX domain-containing protein [Candidatus Woesearchaeota archaeon]